MSRIKGRVILKGILKNESPFVIGTGKGDITDIEILKDEDGMPYIPATSFVGAVKHHIYDSFNIENLNVWRYFWGAGSSENNSDEGIQSHFVVSDIKLKEKLPGILAIRDGIAIDEKTGVAEDRKKYDYEVINKNLKWELNAEIILREKVDEKKLFQILNTVLHELESGQVRIGAFTSKGFGKFKLEEYTVYKFDFPEDGEKYFRFIANLEENSADLCKIDLKECGILQVKDNKDFEFRAKFNLKSSILINSFGTNIKEKKDEEEADKVHIKYDGLPVLPGTSLKGAVRARCEKIINTFVDIQNSILTEKINNLLNNLFGFADDTGRTKQKQKSRLIVEESLIKGAEESEQTRIKIDRFTGGVIEGALVKSIPVWHKNEEIEICLKIKDAKEYEIGLILLVLKDLWNEDLPVGGEKSIGRGLLKGKSAKFRYGLKEYSITQKDDRLMVEGNKDELESFVKEFLKEIGVQ